MMEHGKVFNVDSFAYGINVCLSQSHIQKQL